MDDLNENQLVCDDVSDGEPDTEGSGNNNNDGIATDGIENNSNPVATMNVTLNDVRTFVNNSVADSDVSFDSPDLVPASVNGGLDNEIAAHSNGTSVSNVAKVPVGGFIAADEGHQNIGLDDTNVINGKANNYTIGNASS